jgi:hypothetical protein
VLRFGSVERISLPNRDRILPTAHRSGGAEFMGFPHEAVRQSAGVVEIEVIALVRLATRNQALDGIGRPTYVVPRPVTRTHNAVRALWGGFPLLNRGKNLPTVERVLGF